MPNISTQWSRGGVLRMPSWFSTGYAGGRKFAYGFGGYFSVFGTGSMGPALLATDDPVNDGDMLGYTMLLGYPLWLNKRAERSNDFYGTPGDQTIAGPNDWTWADEIAGDTTASTAVWFDLPDVRGYVVFPCLGTGYCRYESAQVRCDDRKITCYVYDEQDFIDVTRGQKDPWDVRAHSYADFSSPLAGARNKRFVGATLDTTTRTLYALEHQAVTLSGEVAPRHAIHAWTL
jgi:hypothetical protein